MSEKFNQELLGIAGGAAAMELSPEIVNSVFSGLEQGTGTSVSFAAPELAELTGGLVEIAKDVALPLATLLLIWAGLKEMASGFNPENKKHG